MPMGPELRIASLETVGGGHFLEDVEVCQQLLFQAAGRGARVILGSPQRFRDDFVREAKLQKILGGDFERRRSRLPR